MNSLFEAYEDWGADRIVLKASFSDGPKHGASMHFDMRAEAARTLGLALLNAVAKFDNLNAGLVQPEELPVVTSAAKELTPNKGEATFARADGVFVRGFSNPSDVGQEESKTKPKAGEPKFKEGDRVVDTKDRIGTVFNWENLKGYELTGHPCVDCVPVRYDDTFYEGPTRHLTLITQLRKLVLISLSDLFVGATVWLCKEKKVGVVDGRSYFSTRAIMKNKIEVECDGVIITTTIDNLMGIQ